MLEPCGSFTISCPKIFDGEQFLQNHCIAISDGDIAGVYPQSERPADLPHQNLENGILIPGLVDLQVNGGGDALFHNSPDVPTLQTILEAHRSVGTTSILPTLLSGDRELRAAATAAVRTISQSEPGILGIHIEGPYFAPEKNGAHLADALETPTDADIDTLCNTGCRTLITLAPEVISADHIRQLAQAGVIVAAGHTDASFEDIHAAASAGLCGVTHLYNAMSPAMGRAPGTVGAALSDNNLWASIIADGHHVHPASIRLACRAKPAGKLVLVSDAMATTGGNKGDFMLYGERITLTNGKLVNAAGKLAGSAISLIEAVRFVHETVGEPLSEALRMASLYPAEILGLGSTLGRFAPGYRADAVHVSEDLNVLQVWAKGATFNTPHY
ncbi:MAG: N-acetylglucosamine-6-phosphate deacetylase [Halioglobus sp.]